MKPWPQLRFEFDSSSIRARFDYDSTSIRVPFEYRSTAIRVRFELHSTAVRLNSRKTRQKGVASGRQSSNTPLLRRNNVISCGDPHTNFLTLMHENLP